MHPDGHSSKMHKPPTDYLNHDLFCVVRRGKNGYRTEATQTWHDAEPSCSREREREGRRQHRRAYDARYSPRSPLRRRCTIPPSAATTVSRRSPPRRRRVAPRPATMATRARATVVAHRRRTTPLLCADALSSSSPSLCREERAISGCSPDSHGEEAGRGERRRRRARVVVVAQDIRVHRWHCSTEEG
jgi:hypothetical protein